MKNNYIIRKDLQISISAPDFSNFLTAATGTGIIRDGIIFRICFIPLLMRLLQKILTSETG